MNELRHGIVACGMIAAAQIGTAAAVDGLSGVRFEVCQQHGCAQRSEIRLGPDDARRLQQAFGAPAGDARAERRAIARSIAAFEQLVGAKTGTDRDLGGTFPGAFRAGQMDCIDEATNTTRYLHVLDQAGLLRWHSVAEPVTRLPIPRGWWPHSTAVIRERASGTRFAVDSWFEANGRPPHIVDLGRWRRGWKPDAEVAPE